MLKLWLQPKVAKAKAIEELFKKEKVGEITVHLVKGLIRKTKMKLLQLDETINYLGMERPEGGCLLSLVEERSWWGELAVLEGVGVKIANFAARMPVEFSEWPVTKGAEEEKWDKEEVYKYLCRPNQEGKTSIPRLDLAMPMWTRLSKKGLQFRVKNKDLAEALKTWCNTTIDPDAGEEEGGRRSSTLPAFMIIIIFTIVFFQMIFGLKLGLLTEQAYRDNK